MFYKAMLDYLSPARYLDVSTTNHRQTLENECTTLALRHSDVIVALRAVDGLRSSQGRRNIYFLPVELLALIFAESETFVEVEVTISHRKPNIRARAVCRRWRDVIDSTPALWTRLELRRRRRLYQKT